MMLMTAQPLGLAPNPKIFAISGAIAGGLIGGFVGKRVGWLAGTIGGALGLGLLSWYYFSGRMQSATDVTVR